MTTTCTSCYQCRRSQERRRSHCIGLVDANKFWSRLEGTCEDGKNGESCRDEGAESLHDEQYVMDQASLLVRNRLNSEDAICSVNRQQLQLL